MRMKEDDWFDIIQTNLTSIYRLSKAVLRPMMKKGGRIISIGSVVGSMGNPGQTNYCAANPAGKLGSAQDIAKAVAFLASDDAAYINGETIHVNGGLYMN